MIDLRKIAENVIAMDVGKTEELTKAAIKAKISAEEILKKGLIAGMEVVGRQFRDGELFIPEVLMSGEAMKAAMKLLRPLLTKEGTVKRFVGKAAIGTVEGDIHDIGKNLVIMMLEGNGWEVIDLGVDISPEGFCQAVRENDFQVLGLSALLTTTMDSQAKTIEALKAAGLRDKVKIAIGGAPVTQAYADQIGADVYAANAGDAAAKFNELIGK
jgi:5-methyltetrahydrofolate--homocysteine methyltransferase